MIDIGPPPWPERSWSGTIAIDADDSFQLRTDAWLSGSVVALWALAALDKLLTIVAVSLAADPPPFPNGRCAGCGQCFCRCGRGSASRGIE